MAIRISDKLINQVELNNKKAKNIKLFFNSLNKSIPVSQPEAKDFKKVFNYDFLNISYKKGNLKLTIEDTHKIEVKAGYVARRYATYDVEVINNLPNKKKTLLLYVLITKALKKSKNKTTVNTVLTINAIKEYTQLRTSKDIETTLGVIADVLAKNKANLTFNVTKKEAKLSLSNKLETRNIDEKPLKDIDVTDNLSDISMSKLENIFLSVGKEIAKRSNNSEVKAVDSLNALKKETVKDNDVEHLDINKTLNDVNLLIIQEQTNILALEGITAELEKLTQRAETAKAKKNSHRYYMAKLIFENQKQPTDQSKVVLDYLKQQHKTAGKQTLKFNIFDLVKDLGYSTDDEGVKSLSYLMLQLVNNRFADIEIIDDTVLSYDLTPNFEEAKKAEDKIKAIEKEEAEKEAELNRKDKEWAEKHPIIVTLDMLPDFTPEEGKKLERLEYSGFKDEELNHLKNYDEVPDPTL